MDYTQTGKIKSGTIKDTLGNVVLTVGGGNMAITSHRVRDLAGKDSYFSNGEAYVIARELVRLDGWNRYAFSMLIEMDDTFVGERGFLYDVWGECSVTTGDNTALLIDDMDEMGDSHFEADGFYMINMHRVFACPADCGWLYFGKSP